MQSANVKRLRQLEEENMQMKKLLGEQALLIDGYKIALSKSIDHLSENSRSRGV
ncbi:MAG: hypothetical protein K2X81_28915 [Candidatus Obscuribacterales bacterium]|nr:hypothetical protein [Candidatus Obscuribacterales bacterium]